MCLQYNFHIKFVKKIGFVKEEKSTKILVNNKSNITYSKNLVYYDEIYNMLMCDHNIRECKGYTV